VYNLVFLSCAGLAPVATTMASAADNAAPTEDALMAAQHSRNAYAFFEKYDRYDSQELVACAMTHWLLSNEDFRLPTDPPMGIIR
jgi:hypothetical protein